MQNGQPEELKKQLETLRESDEAKGLLFELLGQITAQRTSDDICRTAVEGVRRCLGFEREGLFLVDLKSGWFKGTYGSDLNVKTTDERELIMDDQTGGRIERILKGESDLERGCELGEPRARPGEEDVKADLVALKLRGRLYGILSVDNRLTRRPISDRELAYIFLTSQVLGNALEMTRAREALAQSEERLRQVAENSGSRIWGLDAEGRYTYSSSVVRDVLGVDPEALANQPFIDRVAEEDRDKITAVLEHAKTLGAPFQQLVYHQTRPDGRKVTIETSGMPMVDPQGAFRGYRGASIDVTREIELESQLRHSQKMDVIGRLAGGIAHDFNNLLTSILGYSSLILEDLPKDNPIRADIEQIKVAGDRAASLTRQLLAFSRRQVLHTERMNINVVVQEMEKLLRRTLGEDIQFVTELEPNLEMVEADADRLQQVLLQLAINARDAMFEAQAARGGAAGVKRLTIQTANVTLTEPVRYFHAEVTPGSYVSLLISDTGIGMSDEIKEHLFEPFFTTKGVGKGSGLGLSTVYGIVKQMGGSIQIDSRPGKGTTFQIYLPRAGAEPVRSETRTTTDLKGSGTILVVEDEKTVRALTVRMLQMLGYNVLEAEHGGQALEICRQFKNPIDLVLTDMVMPYMGGKQFVEELHKMRADFKVLFVSGYSSDATVDGEIIGVDVPLIQKPFTRESLARKIKEVMEKK